MVSKRVGFLLAGALALVAVLAVSGVTYVNRDNSAPVKAVSSTKVATTEVVKTNLSDYWTADGALGYKKGQKLHGLGDGLVTWLPKSGASITRGQSLLRVDDRPVSLFYGTTPLFRELRTVSTVGRDVRVVADNLKALGYQIGAQPSAGTYVTVSDGATPKAESSAESTPAATPTPAPSAKTHRVKVGTRDGVYTTSLKSAVKRWQTSKGMQPTGILQFGDVLVLPAKVRIGGITAQLGDPASGELMSVTASTKAVTVSVEASAAGAIDAGDKVQLTLPDSSHTGGTVQSVGTVAQSSDGDDAQAEPKIEITISFDKPSKVRKLSSAAVEVRFTGTVKKGVLAVPVGALLALSGGGYAVQIAAGGALTPVEVGFFADGMVEITGPGLAEGTSVVTTS